MIKKSLLSSFILLAFCFPAPLFAEASLWEIQSIDTMKTSRDLTLYKMDDYKFDPWIEKEVAFIKSLGANYITIDGAYDDKYIPWTKRWVNRARKNNLKIWYRGNFSGWHGWFGPKDMDRAEHLVASRNFLVKHSFLFEDGDALTLCPECEWGGPGNPVETKDFEGFRAFMVEEYNLMNEVFTAQNKNINTSWFSINPDVARATFDLPTVQNTGNVITLDYFIKDLSQLQEGLDYFHTQYPQAKIFVGEFGAPLPDINGKMNENEQAEFVDTILEELYRRKDYVIGVNYWVSHGGPIALLNQDYSPRKVTKVIEQYFKPAIVKGRVTDSEGRPLSNVRVTTNYNIKPVLSNTKGEYTIIIPAKKTQIRLEKDEYSSYQFVHNFQQNEVIEREVKLSGKDAGLLNKILHLIRSIFD